MTTHTHSPHPFSLYFWCLVIFGINVVSHAKPIPEPFTEYLYLPCLVRQFDPSYFAQDWTLTGPWLEHWCFNLCFGFWTQYVSLSTVAWFGRLGCWLAVTLALYRIGRTLTLAPMLWALGTGLWLLSDQSLVANSWMVGGFEAKTVAYPLLLFALHGFLTHRQWHASILLGLCFSMHPAVGLFGGLACGVAFLSQRPSLRQLVQSTSLIVLCAMPGLLPTLQMVLSDGNASDAIWRFVALVQQPQHLDPFSWTKRRLLLLGLMFSFNLGYGWRNRRDSTILFLLWFQSALALFFGVGFLLRGLEQFALLRFFPFRLFPLFVPLLFFLQLMRFYQDWSAQAMTAPSPQAGPSPAPESKHTLEGPLSGSPTYSNALLLLAFFCVLGFPGPFGQLIDRLNTNRQLWTQPPDDLQRSFRWLARHSPKDAVVIAPPWRVDAWQHSQRAQIVNWWAIRYDQLEEWRTRLRALVGEITPGKPVEKVAAMKRHYHQLTLTQVRQVAKRYRASYLISRRHYPLPLQFRTATYRVYRLAFGTTRPATTPSSRKPS